MIVICDNSALSALAEAELLDLLPRLFGFVIIPESALRGWLDFDEGVTRIQGCGFHVSEAVIEAVRRKL